MNMQLEKIIKDKLTIEGQMPFDEFMHLALYAPQFGYYTGNLAKIGRDGDFVTAPSLTPLFGATLAEACIPVIANCDGACILEFGAGRGQLCVDILSALDSQNMLPEKYYILDVSMSLQAMQRAYISEKTPNLLSRVEWITEMPNKFSGVVIANEVLDAMPVRRFLKKDGQLLEEYIRLDTTTKDAHALGLITVFDKPKDAALEEILRPVFDELPEGYTSEVNVWARPWIKSIHESLDKGIVLLIDYGFSQQEYFHPDRHMGTLMCHHQHKAHTNPYIHIGEQDITAHVDFTHIAEAAFSLGFHVAGYTDQASFLLSLGILEKLQHIQDTIEYTKASMAVKLLTDPSEMGDLFKVLALTKSWEGEIRGFELIDRRGKL